jgi:hypothetical protein
MFQSAGENVTCCSESIVIVDVQASGTLFQSFKLITPEFCALAGRFRLHHRDHRGQVYSDFSIHWHSGELTSRRGRDISLDHSGKETWMSADVKCAREMAWPGISIFIIPDKLPSRNFLDHGTLGYTITYESPRRYRLIYIQPGVLSRQSVDPSHRFGHALCF